MDIKDYLKKCRSVSKEIANKTELIATLRSEAGKMTKPLSYVKVQESGDSRPMADCVDEMTDLEQEIKKRQLSLVGLYKEMVYLINKIPDQRQRLVLEKKYICNKSIHEICYEMDLSERRVYDIQAEALAELTKIMNSELDQMKYIKKTA